MLAFLLAALLQTNPAPVRIHLTVLGGSGSGAYSCGEKVSIVADRRRDRVFDVWFAGWDGDTAIDRVHGRKTVVTLPCKDVTIEAKFAVKPPRRKS